MSVLDDYFSGLDAPAQAAFESIRDIVRAAVPEVEEGMGYGIAALRYRGRPRAGSSVQVWAVSALGDRLTPPPSRSMRSPVTTGTRSIPLPALGQCSGEVGQPATAAAS
jgi:hypothetical protein